jgi:hypothetical protein
VTRRLCETSAVSVEQVPITFRSRLQRPWDWYIDLGFGAWLLALGVLTATCLVIAVLVGHGDTKNTACGDAEKYVALIDSYDGKTLTAPQVARLRVGATHLQAASAEAVGAPKRVLAEAAGVASLAREGRRFDGRFVPGRFASVCEFGGGGDSFSRP